LSAAVARPVAQNGTAVANKVVVPIDLNPYQNLPLVKHPQAGRFCATYGDILPFI
jgi:hypothetical protein